MHKSIDKFKTKKKIRINSLEAAICNVALFKSMKDKQFRDSIFISYCEEGVILEALSDFEWKRAHDHIESFLHNKKIQLLIDGYDKDEYQSLINKGLKQITRKIRQTEEQCPYINIIHYQKLRKSCEYMDKQKYVEPLKDWQKKNKKNPNFAFLIVEPKHKFDEIKRSLLEYLLNEPVKLTITVIQPIQFIYLLSFSPSKQTFKANCNRRQIEVSIDREEGSESQVIKAVNFTKINLNQNLFSIVRGNSKITKSGVGLETISASEMKQQIKNAKLYCKDNPTELLEQYFEKIEGQFGHQFVVVPYRKEDQEKYRALIEKYLHTKFSKEEIDKKLQMHKVFQFEEVQFLQEIFIAKNYKSWKVCINSCPFLIHEFSAEAVDIDTFIIYLDQLQLYYCTYMIRYYGIILKKSKQTLSSGSPSSYLLVFDYHRNNLVDMIESDMVLDGLQVANIILQILYLVNFLHSHEQPRCLGPIDAREIFWPMATILPYLGVSDDEPNYSIENDVKQIGLLMKELLGQEVDQELAQLYAKMTSPSKYQRPSAKKCICELQELLCL